MYKRKKSNSGGTYATMKQKIVKFVEGRISMRRKSNPPLVGNDLIST
jgi:hypothetical protein